MNSLLIPNAVDAAIEREERCMPYAEATIEFEISHKTNDFMQFAYDKAYDLVEDELTNEVYDALPKEVKDDIESSYHEYRLESALEELLEEDKERRISMYAIL